MRDHGDDALQFLPLPHRRRAGPCALAADVDQRGAGLEHVRGMRLGNAGPVEKFATVGEAVWGEVENPHHLRLVEPDDAGTQLERGMDAGEIGPLLLHRRRQVGQCRFEFGRGIELARGDLALAPRDQREAAGIGKAAGEPQCRAAAPIGFGLGAEREGDGLEIVRGAQGSVARR